MNKILEILQQNGVGQDIMDEICACINTDRRNMLIENGLARSGARNATAVRALLDENNISLGENNELIGFDEALATVKNNCGYLFGSAGYVPKQGRATPDFNQMSDLEYFNYIKNR